MKKNYAMGLIMAGMLGATTSAYAQYPQITPEAQAKYKEMITAAYAHADSAWAKALPIVETQSNKFSLPSSNDNKVIKEGTTDDSGEIKIDSNELEAGTYTIVLTGEEDSKTLNFTIGNK